MSVFKTVFDKSLLYDLLFLNVERVLEYPTLNELKINNPKLYNIWHQISKNRYERDDETIYQTKGILYPEFSKIACISYGIIYMKDDKISRMLKEINHLNEIQVLNEFIEMLNFLKNKNNNLKLCGWNLINSDIPFIIKRILHHGNKLAISKIPQYLLDSLDDKPWDSKIVDVSIINKFNGFGIGDEISFNLFAEFMNYNTSIDLMEINQISQKYWQLNDDINSENNRLKYISNYSMNKLNIIMRFMKEIREK